MQGSLANVPLPKEIVRACVAESHPLELLRLIAFASKYLSGCQLIFRSFCHLLGASFSAQGEEREFENAVQLSTLAEIVLTEAHDLRSLLGAAIGESRGL
uniref:hypothetical protein n=1 Tax=Variovorax sp. BK018 TaxID=3450241 RepID=UPI004039B105